MSRFLEVLNQHHQEPVRDLAVALNEKDRVAWYQVMSENFEVTTTPAPLVERDRAKD